MKKKILLMFSMVAILTALLAISIGAVELIETWDISASNNDNVTAYLYADPNNSDKYTLTISGTGNMKDFGWGSAPWCSSYSQKIISATIENGITNIGSDAFFSCRGLTSAIIGDSVTTIGTRAFGWCSLLTSVVIGDGLTNVGDYSFYYCDALSNVVIPKGVTEIGEWAFAHCTLLKSMEIPNNVASIGVYAFAECYELTIYCEAESLPEGWDSGWNYSNCPVVWGYFDEEACLNKIFTFKGYSFGFAGQISVGFDIDYEALAKYEEKTGKTLEIGVLFAGFDNLGGKQPLDENGQAITLNVGKVIKADLTTFNYPGYGFVLNDVVDSIKDVKLVISAYICDGEGVWYVQENGLSNTVSGISYNEAKESIGE